MPHICADSSTHHRTYYHSDHQCTHPFQMQSLSIAALYYLAHSHKHLRYTHTQMHTHAITHILTQPSILTHIPNSPLNKPHPFKHTQPLISKHLSPSSAVHDSAPSLRTSFLFRRFPAHTRHTSLSYTTTYILLSLNHQQPTILNVEQAPPTQWLASFPQLQ